MTPKSLMLGATFCVLVAPAFAYTTSSGTTTVTDGATTYPSSAYQTNNPGYPHEDMGSIAAPDEAATTTTTTTTTSVGTSVGSTPLRTVSANNQSMQNKGSNGAGVSNKQQISACLCMEQSYQSLQSQVSAKQAAYDQAVQQRATLDNQLASQRANATPDVNAVRATSQQRIMLQGQINDVYIPQLQAATSQYNGAVGQYKQSCAGKLFDANVEAQVQSTLQCHG